MKKCMLLLLSITLAFWQPTTASAAVPTDTTITTIVEIFEDGSYIETVIEKKTSSFSARSTTSTLTGKRTLTYRNSEGSALWSVTVTGTFTYNGSSATCTKSTVSATSYNSNWRISSSSASKSGATAKATASAKRYMDGTYIRTMTQSVSLTCRKNGTLS